jgi:hypothetical protein
VDNVDRDDDVPLNQIFLIIEQEKVPSIGGILIGLNRPLPPMSNRAPVHRGPTIECAILRTSINRNTNAGPPHGSGNTPTQWQSSEGSYGSKQPMDASKV